MVCFVSARRNTLAMQLTAAARQNVPGGTSREAVELIPGANRTLAGEMLLGQEVIRELFEIHAA